MWQESGVGMVWYLVWEAHDADMVGYLAREAHVVDMVRALSVAGTWRGHGGVHSVAGT